MGYQPSPSLGTRATLPYARHPFGGNERSIEANPMNLRLARRIIALALITAPLAVNGCKEDRNATGAGATGSKSDAPVDRVAIVDMDRVANELGWMREMQNNVSNLSNSIRTDYTR